MDIWIESLVDVVITDTISHGGAFKLCPLVICMAPLCLLAIFKGRLDYCNIMLLLTVFGVSQKQAFPLYE